MKRMRALVGERPRFGYRRIAALLRREGWAAGATRILRLWRREGLKVPIKRRNKRAHDTGVGLNVDPRVNLRLGPSALAARGQRMAGRARSAAARARRAAGPCW